jgi:hypothetical protein
VGVDALLSLASVGRDDSGPADGERALIGRFVATDASVHFRADNIYQPQLSKVQAPQSNRSPLARVVVNPDIPAARPPRCVKGVSY